MRSSIRRAASGCRPAPTIARPNSSPAPPANDRQASRSGRITVMTETTEALRSKQGNNDAPQATNIASRPLVRPIVDSWAAVCGIDRRSRRQRLKPNPTGSPTANGIFSNCTFTTDQHSQCGPGRSDSARISIYLQGDQIQASYIIIYVRENPNDGQLSRDDTSFTGPVLCTNVRHRRHHQTTEGTAIAGPVDIRVRRKSSHLQVRPTAPRTRLTRKSACATRSPATPSAFSSSLSLTGAATMKTINSAAMAFLAMFAAAPAFAQESEEFFGSICEIDTSSADRNVPYAVARWHPLGLHV